MDTLTLLVALLIVVITYSYFLWIAGTSVHQIESVDDYFIAGRKLKTGTFFATLYAAEMSIATVFIAFFDLASFLGFQLLASILTFSVGQFVLSRLAPRIKSANKSRLTLPGVLGEQYNSPLLRLVSLATITIGFGGLFATEILVGAQLIKPLFKADVYIVAMLFIATIVTFYTMLGGFKNVIRTDKLQSLFVITGMIALVIAALSIDTSPTEIIKNSAAKGIIPSLSLFFNFLVINVAYPLVDLAAWQRIAAAKDAKTAKRGGGLGAGAFFVCWITILLSAIILVSNSNKGTGAEMILSSFLLSANSSWWQAIIAGLGLGSLLAALLSAGDIFLITATQALCMDATKHKYFVKNQFTSTEDIQVLAHSRKLTFVVAVLSLIFVGFLMKAGARVSDLVFVLYGATTALLPSIILILAFPGRSLKNYSFAANSSSIAGIFMGWFYGFLALAGSDSIKSILAYIDPVPGAVSTYNAACVALTWSFGFFIIFSLFKKITSKE